MKYQITKFKSFEVALKELRAREECQARDTPRGDGA
jgi:hypothetical protein